MSESAPALTDLLVMAVALHGSPPDVVDGKRDPTANGMEILKQTLIWCDAWDGGVNNRVNMSEPPEADQHYRRLIGLCRPKSEGNLVAGFGNLGDVNEWNCYPSYVAFGLTSAGRTRAEELFARFPDYSTFYEDPEQQAARHCRRAMKELIWFVSAMMPIGRRSTEPTVIVPANEVRDCFLEKNPEFAQCRESLRQHNLEQSFTLVKELWLQRGQ